MCGRISTRSEESGQTLLGPALSLLIESTDSSD